MGRGTMADGGPGYRAIITEAVQVANAPGEFFGISLEQSRPNKACLPDLRVRFVGAKTRKRHLKKQPE